MAIIKQKFSKRAPSNITVKGLQEQFPDLILGVKPLNNGKVAVSIPNGRLIIDSNNE